MEITPQLIEQFFNNKCSSGEAEEIAAYLSENKDVREKYLGDEEWRAISDERQINIETSQQLLQMLQRQLFFFKPTLVVSFKKRIVKPFVAAASVILLIGASWWYMQKSEPSIKGIFVAAENIPQIKNETLPINWQVKSNTGQSAMKVTLADGSVITLFKNTVIKYPKSFNGDTREIHLNGDAFFEVAKNKLKPFIVFSGNLSTTALGTSFRITAFEKKSAIQVKLLTGKVVIKSIKQTVGWKQDVFLTPGEQLSYDIKKATAIVAKFNANDANISSVTGQAKNNTSNDLKFNTSPLKDVMKALATLHHIKINYIEAEISGMNFTGTINRYDDIQSIMKVIAKMNDLEVIQTPEGFNIQMLRKQP